MDIEEKKSGSIFVATIKFLPLVVLALLVIIFGLDLLIAAPIATVVAILIAMWANKFNFKDIFQSPAKMMLI